MLVCCFHLPYMTKSPHSNMKPKNLAWRYHLWQKHLTQAPEQSSQPPIAHLLDHKMKPAACNRIQLRGDSHFGGNQAQFLQTLSKNFLLWPQKGYRTYSLQLYSRELLHCSQDRKYRRSYQVDIYTQQSDYIQSSS